MNRQSRLPGLGTAVWGLLMAALVVALLAGPTMDVTEFREALEKAVQR